MVILRNFYPKDVANELLAGLQVRCPYGSLFLLKYQNICNLYNSKFLLINTIWFLSCFIRELFNMQIDDLTFSFKLRKHEKNYSHEL